MMNFFRNRRQRSKSLTSHDIHLQFAAKHRMHNQNDNGMRSSKSHNSGFDSDHSLKGQSNGEILKKLETNPDLHNPENVSLLEQLENETIPVAYLIQGLSRKKAHRILLRLATLYPEIIEKEIRIVNKPQPQQMSQETLVTPLILAQTLNQQKSVVDANARTQTSNLEQQQKDPTPSNTRITDVDVRNSIRNSQFDSMCSQLMQAESLTVNSSSSSELSDMNAINQMNDQKLADATNKIRHKAKLLKQKAAHCQNMIDEMNRIANRLGFNTVQDLRQASKIYQILGASVNGQELDKLRQRSQSLAIDLQLEQWKVDQVQRSSQLNTKISRLFDLSQIVTDSDVDSLHQAAPKAQKQL